MERNVRNQNDHDKTVRMNNEERFEEIARQNIGENHFIICSEIKGENTVSLAHAIKQEDGTMKHLRHAMRMSQEDLLDFCDSVYDKLVEE